MTTPVTKTRLVVYCTLTAVVASAAVALLTASAAPSRAVPVTKWEYRQIAPTADFSEWNRLGQEGWEFAGTFERAVIFKRAIITP